MFDRDVSDFVVVTNVVCLRSIIGGRTSRKPPYFVLPRQQTTAIIPAS